MLLLNFKNWSFSKTQLLPNAQKAMLKKDFDTLQTTLNLDVIETLIEQPVSLSKLFFENKTTIGVSSIKNIASYYQLIDTILEKKNKEVIDYTEASQEEIYFSGAENLNAHLNSEIAICGINKHTDESLFEEYCEDFELTPFSFEIPDNLSTRDICVFTNNTLLICLDLIKDKKVKKNLIKLLHQNNIQIINLQQNQISTGILNLIYSDNTIIMSQTTKELFHNTQLSQLNKHTIKIINCPTLELAQIKLRDIIL